jgi:YfiR/HmsC-like
MMTLLAVAGALTVSAQPASAQRDEVSEYELKAAILYNLSRFVEWPPSTYADSQAPTVLCILGQDPFGAALKTLEQKQDGNSRPVSIRRLKNENGIRDCHILYISTSERKSVVQILSRLKGSNVLTVGEMSRFAAQGGIIQFTLADKQVRFDINLDAASRMTLKISSRLLVLARISKDQRRIPDSTGEPAAAAPIAMPSAFFLPLAEPVHGASGETLTNTLGKTPGSQYK